ncbi:enolase C-terminal domain-like protein [Psychromarinibacter halotolerans]|uniref:Enolase C-terminal domain-like protein n=1 Tax=Psychromarinibacter halotolerans TaxID=1775175 RepID=A0ABV7GXH0_9RHOB|nr:enolase C-terminal domain-like protein [Psychromarinibacter halotolerans]MAQ85454.1 L-rhamnonate dehydratase [Maritimibacter sp.]MDF0595271.1 enolase C-terminal domain-like protein [Psychromarinibacter halotolerans]
MKIARIEAFPIQSDMKGALYKGDGTEGRRPPWTKGAEVAGPMSGYARFKKLRSTWRYDGAVGCLVTAEDGTTGFGMTRYDLPVIHLVNDHFAPLLVGEDCMAIERLWDMMVRMASPYGVAGIPSYAISAVDLALWDLKGKLLGQPVYALAGGPVRDDLFVYATGNDTDWHMELGFRGTKLACPYGLFDGLDGLARNEALVAERREMVGPDVELMLDCWMAFDVEFAVRLSERLKPYGLRWIEDCLLPENAEAHDELRRRLPGQTLATGEHWYALQSFATACTRRMADILQPDICWAGGFTGCRKIAQLAEAHGLEVCLHAGANTPYGQHLSVTSPAIRWAEYFVGGAPGVPLEENRVFPTMPVPVGGRIAPSDAPGFGLEMTDALLESMRR